MFLKGSIDIHAFSQFNSLMEMPHFQIIKTNSQLDPIIYRNSLNMDTLYCYHCFKSILINPSLKFYLGEGAFCSEHILCENCVCEKCKLCRRPYRKIEINKKMETRYLKNFLSVDELNDLMKKSIRLEQRRLTMFNTHYYNTVFKNLKKKESKKQMNLRVPSVEQTVPRTGERSKERTLNGTEASFRNAMDKYGKCSLL